MQAWDFTVTGLSGANPHSNGASTHESRAAAGLSAAVCSLGTYSASGYTCAYWTKCISNQSVLSQPMQHVHKTGKFWQERDLLDVQSLHTECIQKLKMAKELDSAPSNVPITALKWSEDDFPSCVVQTVYICIFSSKTYSSKMGPAVALPLIFLEGLQNCAASTTYWQSYRHKHWTILLCKLLTQKCWTQILVIVFE